MPVTYEPISTQTLSSTSASVTLSSIPSTYTDLVIVCNIGISVSGQTVQTIFNGNTGANYSFTELAGTGSSASSGRLSSRSNIYSGYGIAPSTDLSCTLVFNVNNYANTTTHKVLISRESSNGAGTFQGTNTIVGLWRSTAAIYEINFTPSTGNFIVGSTFTLYGIKAA
jgi:hypothetical protein